VVIQFAHRGHVGAIGREARDYFGKNATEAVQSEIARPSMLLRNTIKLAREDGLLARHGYSQHEPLALVDEIVKIALGIDETAIQGLESFVVLFLDKQPVEHIEELITGCAIHRPILGQTFETSQDLLHNYVKWAISAPFRGCVRRVMLAICCALLRATLLQQ